MMNTIRLEDNPDTNRLVKTIRKQNVVIHFVIVVGLFKWKRICAVFFYRLVLYAMLLEIQLSILINININRYKFCQQGPYIVSFFNV